MGKESGCHVGDTRDAGSIPGLGRSREEGHSNTVHCSCLENPMDRGSWQVTVHGVTSNITISKLMKGSPMTFQKYLTLEYKVQDLKSRSNYPEPHSDT